MGSLPTVTKNLLIINVLMFLGTYVAGLYGISLDEYLGLRFVLSDRFNAAQLITYMFMHGGFIHLFFNMFAVWMFGRILEQVWGPQRFLFYYMVCGIGAGLIQEIVVGVEYASLTAGLPADVVDTVREEGGQILRNGQNYVDSSLAHLNYTLNGITVGASGAVYAILLGFGMLFPNQRMFIIPIPFPIKAKWLILAYIVIELWAAFSNNPSDNVAHFAHLGGMLFGFLLIVYWRRNNRRNNMYYG